MFAIAAAIACTTTQAEPFAYVTNQASEDKVWVVDVATNAVVDSAWKRIGRRARPELSD
jgi:hypothetical protein